MTNKKILIVDDEPDLREALKEAMTAGGFDVVTAATGQEGLDSALAQKPDLILLDILMPEMNGHQVLYELRKDVWGKTVPVLLLTNADDPKNVVQGFDMKGNDYLIKSNISLEEIVKRVKQYIAGYQ